MGVYIYQSGTETELKNAYIGEYTGRLPSAYQEVEYIQSSGSGNSGQYIDTGFTFSGNSGSVYIEYTPLSLGNLYYTCRTSGGYNGTNRAINIYGLYSPFYFGIGGNDINSGLSMSVNTKYTVNITANNGNYSLDFNGQTSTGTYSGTIANNATIAVFCSHEDAPGAEHKYNYMASMKLYSYKIYDNGTLARDLVPCYRKADTEIGMYDLVNDVFYTNSGTGTFTKGPDVN